MLIQGLSKTSLQLHLAYLNPGPTLSHVPQHTSPYTIIAASGRENQDCPGDLRRDFPVCPAGLCLDFKAGLQPPISSPTPSARRPSPPIHVVLQEHLQDAGWLCLSPPLFEVSLDPKSCSFLPSHFRPTLGSVRFVHPHHSAFPGRPPCKSRCVRSPFTSLPNHPTQPAPLCPPSIKPQLTQCPPLHLGLFIPSSKSPPLFTSQPASKMILPSPFLHPSMWRETGEVVRNLALLLQETFANSSQRLPPASSREPPRWDIAGDRSLVEGLADGPTRRMQGHRWRHLLYIPPLSTQRRQHSWIHPQQAHVWVARTPS